MFIFDNDIFSFKTIQKSCKNNNTWKFKNIDEILTFSRTSKKPEVSTDDNVNDYLTIIFHQASTFPIIATIGIIYNDKKLLGFIDCNIEDFIKKTNYLTDETTIITINIKLYKDELLKFDNVDQTTWVRIIIKMVQVKDFYLENNAKVIPILIPFGNLRLDDDNLEIFYKNLDIISKFIAKNWGIKNIPINCIMDILEKLGFEFIDARLNNRIKMASKKINNIITDHLQSVAFGQKMI